MELTRKIFEHLAFNTSLKTEEDMLIVMNKTTHEELLYQTLETNKKQFEKTLTFVTAYNGIFNITSTNNNFYFAISVPDENGLITVSIPAGAYEIENLSDEIPRIIVEAGHFTAANYPFTVEPNFLTLSSKMEISIPFPNN